MVPQELYDQPSKWSPRRVKRVSGHPHLEWPHHAWRSISIAADVIWLDTIETKNWPALNIVDIASTYQVVIPVKSTKSGQC